MSVLAMTLLLATGCKREEILSFGGQMDQFTATDADGSKTYLGHAEEWIYWEEGDNIKAYCDGSTSVCDLVSGSGTLEAFFKSQSTLPVDEPVFAIYPASSYGSSYTDLIFPASQPYRESTSPTHPDSSFGRGALPMVAWEEAGTDHAIYFHVVAGILRLQFFSSTTETIDSITFEEVSAEPKQISGHFTIVNINQNMPHLTPAASPAAGDYKIVISNVNSQVGPNKLLTFYLPLPAITSPSAYTNYKLKMTIKTKSGNGNNGKYFVRTLGADIHRRNITMMRALEIKSWSSSPTGDMGSDVKLVGSGTKDRPFQIYTGEELDLVRQAFKTGGTINGQTITGVTNVANELPNTDNATHFKIVRSDIQLLNETDYNNLTDEQKASKKYVMWNEGIENFKGYMYFASSTATNGGITNRSNAPLFESIHQDGYVYRVYVKGTSTPTVANGQAFSPMCYINNGTMLECHNKCAVTLSNPAHLAGLCVTNSSTGRIMGGANEAALTTEGNVSGICYTNNGYIQGSFTLSVAVPQGANISGIAFNNNSTVEECQVSSNIPVNSSGNWGIVVFNNNSTGTINNCVAAGTLIYTIDGSVGGICNTNSGVVKNCTNRVEVRASQGNVGGIVATMNNANAEVYNCCNTAPFTYGAIDQNHIADNCGGLVGELLKGKLYNCYNASLATGATNSGGMIGYLANDATADVQNCCSAQGQSFVGQYETGASVGVYCFSATLMATKCNLITNADVIENEIHYYPFDVRIMRPSATGYDQTLGGNVNPDTLVRKNCGVALNAWVDYKNAGGSKYYNWTTTTGQRPVFRVGLVAKKSRKR